MPSDRKQFNVRMPPEWDDERIERVRRFLAGQLGIDVNRTDLVFYGLREIESRMPTPHPESPKRPSRKKKAE